MSNTYFTRSYRGLRLAGLVCLVLLVSACGSRSANTVYYVLESGESSPVADLDKMNSTDKNTLARMQLRRVDVPGYLDRNALVTREADGVRLNLADFHAWAEPLNLGAQRVLTETLTPLLLQNTIALQAVDDDVRGPLQIFVQILRMDGPLQGDVVLDARWSLRDSEDKTMTRGAFVDKEATGGTYEGLVKAQSILLKKLGKNMAEGISKAVQSRR